MSREIHAGYAICAEPRSGGTFLAQLLASTELLGRPHEFFTRPRLRAEMRRDPARGVAKLLERASTPNGIYGLKISSYQFDLMARTRWTERVPGLHFIFLEREDLLGQAISYVRAEQTRQYRSTQAARIEPHYDPRAIAAKLRILATAHARWNRYFARKGCRPLRPTYEQMLRDPQEMAACVSAFLGLDERPRVDMAKIDVEIMRDALSDEWRRRFVAEKGEGKAVGGRALDRLLPGSVRRGLRQMRDILDAGARARDPREWP